MFCSSKVSQRLNSGDVPPVSPPTSDRSQSALHGPNLFKIVPLAELYVLEMTNPLACVFQDAIDELLAGIPDQPYKCCLCSIDGLDFTALLVHELSSQHQTVLETDLIQLTGVDASGEPILGEVSGFES